MKLLTKLGSLCGLMACMFASLSCVKALAAHVSDGNYKSWSILNLVDEALHVTSSTSLDEGADL